MRKRLFPAFSGCLENLQPPITIDQGAGVALPGRGRLPAPQVDDARVLEDLETL